MSERYTVQQGDCLASIAAEHGFAHWETIYNHADNADLRARRPNPSVLFPGDAVVIPDIAPRVRRLPAGQTHRIVVPRAPTHLRLVLRDDAARPLAGRPYELVIDGDTRRGTTDAAGKLDERIPADARHATVTVTLPAPDGEPDAPTLAGLADPHNEDLTSALEYFRPGRSAASAGTLTLELSLGHLDPVEEVTGLQARLENLGFYRGPVDGDASPETVQAVRAFQVSEGLDPSGEVDAALRARLEQRHLGL